MTARGDARRARRETVVLALLTYRPGGWTVNQLQAHCGGMFVNLYVILLRLEESGRVRSWWVDGPYPRRRLYDVAEAPEVEEADLPYCTPMDEAHTLPNGHTVFCRVEGNRGGAWVLTGTRGSAMAPVSRWARRSRRRG